jgi:alpha-beta hydrolase superfamily lysophospholipase
MSVNLKQFWLILCLWGCALSLVACTAADFPNGKKQVTPALGQRLFLQAGDGVELPVYRWQPPGKVRGNLLLLHGFNEYSGAFAEVGEAFARQGISVWAYDQRGFGRSAHRGLWAGAERMAQDAREMAALIRKTEPDLPLTLLGMSMGGAVALLAAGEEMAADAVVLVAPAVWTRETQPFYQRWALDVAKTIAPAWSPTGEGLKIRPSDNIAMLRRIWQSPWMIRQSRIDTVAGLVALMDKGYAAAPEMTVPVLLLYGDHDELVPEKPVNLLWERLPKQGNTRQIRYKNGWHMLMRDLQGKKVISDIVQWVPGVP